MRNRGVIGIQFLIYAAIALAVIGAVWGAIAWHASVHYQRGQAEKQIEWDAANRKAEAEAKERQQAVDAAIAVAQMEVLEAEETARAATDKWQEARRAANRNRTPLAACPEPRPSGGGHEPGGGGRGIAMPASPAGSSSAGSGGGVRLTMAFVLLYDGAWTGLDGKPLPQAAAGNSGADSAGVTPYGPEDIIDVHGINAQRCSEDRRSLAALMNRIEAAATAWDKGSQR